MTDDQLALDVAGRMETAAQLSPCGTYRYSLLRRWAPTGPCLRWVMLNPSTADAETDDPTIRRVIRFSRDAGYSGCVVANLYALRATDPHDLAVHRDPVGPLNDHTLARLVQVARLGPKLGGGPLVAAWGAKAPADRVAAVLAGPLDGMRLRCLGTTNHGHPRHPLYVRGDQPLVTWREAA